MTPEQAAAARARLEERQLASQPIILGSRHNFRPALAFSLPQKHDPILNLTKPILRSHSYSTFAGFVNPLHIEPLFSCDVAYLYSGSIAMYAIGRYGMMAKVPLMLSTEGGVLVLQGDHFVEFTPWLES